MTDIDPILDTLRENSRRQSNSHAAFLSTRASGLADLAGLIALQTGQPDAAPSCVKALFDRNALEEFATRSISTCFGPEYRIFEGRRYPRIPNGDLLLMDRVIEIQGTRHQLKPGASITTQYQVLSQAWFGSQPGDCVPYFTLMEMALQPCGFLSAYLGTAFLNPNEDYYFRNLDGNAVLHSQPRLHGQVVTARAELRSSALSGGTIIQKFAFSLSVSGQDFYEGESVFGYFSYASMAAQAGLDGGHSLPPRAGWTPAASPLQAPQATSLQLLDRIFPYTDQSSPLSGLWAERTINPADWFFERHFYQDPVMPGSLGIEAMVQALQHLAVQRGDAQAGQPYQFLLNQPLSWKYRGQILRSTPRMLVEVALDRVESLSSGKAYIAKASLWGDTLRLYEVTNLGLIF